MVARIQVARIDRIRERLREKYDPPAWHAFECPHAKREYRRRVISDGRVTVWNQCLVCGSAGQNISAKGVDLDALPWFDEELRDRYYRDSGDPQRAAREAAWKSHREARRAAYREYLATPEWGELRELVMLRAQGICEGCRKRRASDVHHLTYEHVGEEFLWELHAVCRSCHERWHGAPFGEDFSDEK